MGRWRVYEDDRGRDEWFLNPLGVVIEADDLDQAIARAIEHPRVSPGSAYHIEPVEGSAAFEVDANGNPFVDIRNGSWTVTD